MEFTIGKNISVDFVIKVCRILISNLTMYTASLPMRKSKMPNPVATLQLSKLLTEKTFYYPADVGVITNNLSL